MPKQPNLELIDKVTKLYAKASTYTDIAKECKISDVWAKEVCVRYATEEQDLARIQAQRSKFNKLHERKYKDNN